MSAVAQRGFSMIEVLVSLLVLTIGVIGAAGMQLTALRTTQQAVFQTAALQLAAELADKMRANDQAMKKAKTDNPKTGNPFVGIDYTTTTEPEAPDIFCYDTTVDCKADALAEFDIYEWQKRLKTALPSARVVVCRDSTPWDEGAGAYKWACDEAAGAGAAVVIKIGWLAKNPDGTLIRDASKNYTPSLALAVAPYIQ